MADVKPLKINNTNGRRREFETGDTIAVEFGGTGATTAVGARTNLGVGTAGTLASDTDGTLTANSDSNVATQRAIKAYVDAHAGTVAWKRVALLTASGSPSSLDITDALHAVGSYAILQITVGNFVPGTNSVQGGFQFSSNGGSTWETGTNYAWVGDYTIPTVTTGDGNNSTFNMGYISDSIQNTAGFGLNAKILITNFNVASPTTAVIEAGVRRAGHTARMNSTVTHSGSTAWNAIKFFFDSGTISSGTILVEGLIETSDLSTIVDASETAKGIQRNGTQAEVNTGTLASVTVTPEKLANYVGFLKPTAAKTANYTAAAGELVIVNMSGASSNVVITPPASGLFAVLLTSQSFSYYCYVSDSSRFNRYWMSRPGDTASFRYVGGAWQFDRPPFLQHWIGLPESLYPTALPVDFARDIYPGPNAPSPTDKGWVTRGNVVSLTGGAAGMSLEATAATSAAHTNGGAFIPKPSGSDWAYLLYWDMATSTNVHTGGASIFVPFGGFAILADAASDFSVYGKSTSSTPNTRYPHQYLARTRWSSFTTFSSSNDSSVGNCEYGEYRYLKFTCASNTGTPLVSSDGRTWLSHSQLPVESVNAFATVDYVGVVVGSYGTSSPKPQIHVPVFIRIS